VSSSKGAVMCVCVCSKSSNQTLFEYNCSLAICSEILRLCNCLSEYSYKYVLEDNGVQKNSNLVSHPCREEN
jgi:hypothetical protein